MAEYEVDAIDYGSYYPGWFIESWPTPCVAPIVKPKPSTSGSLVTDLIGWTVTWNSPRIDLTSVGTDGYYVAANSSWKNPLSSMSLYSRSWVRPPLSGTGGYAWGDLLPASVTWQGKLSGTYMGTRILSFNNLVDCPPWTTPHDLSQPAVVWTPSVTCNENKTKLDDLRQTVAFSDFVEGLPQWAVQYSYQNTGADAGKWIDPTPPMPTRLYPVPTGDCEHGEFGLPSVSVNSSGQKFVAFEHNIKYSCPGHISTSGVDVTWTPYHSDVWPSSVSTRYDEPYIPGMYTPEGYLFWKRQPSISGAPKTPDKDLGSVELSLWKQCELGPGNIMVPVNQIDLKYYKEGAGTPGTGLWNDVVGAGGATGQWPQRSFSPFNPGFQQVWKLGPFGLANDLSTPVGIYAFVHGNYARKGTFDTVQSYNLYRQETRVVGCASPSLIWGNVTVNDPTHELRQVKLYIGTDTNGYSSATELRDSLFRTEVFDLHPDEHIDYFRAIYNQCCDCAVSAVQNTSFHMTYTVELVHPLTSTIDTLEVLHYSPGNGQFVQDRVVHLDPDTLLEDVYLRVRGDIGGVDSAYHFTDEHLDGSYPSTGDTTLALKRAITVPVPVKDGLAVLPPFPNPIVSDGFDVAVYYPAGSQIIVALSDMLGRNVAGPLQVTSDGGWQRISLPAPAASGSYLLRVKAGNDDKTYVVIVNR